jgi:hypothetical protein
LNPAQAELCETLPQAQNKTKNGVEELTQEVESCWCQSLMPIILATQNAETSRIMVQSQPRQTVHVTLS